MHRRVWLLGFGAAAFLVGCASTSDDSSQVNSSTSTASTSAATTGTAVSPIPAGQPPAFPNPVMAAKDIPAVPGLLQPTNAKARVPAIAQGRRDPFSAVPLSPLAVKPASKGSKLSPGSLPVSQPRLLPPLKSGLLPTQPISSGTTALPPLTIAALPPNGSGLPSVPISSAPLSRTHLADEVEVTGAVQVGGKWNVIVKEPGSPTSRYVRTGDYLANGKVLVKRIIAGADPAVVLQQNGIEVLKNL